MKLKGIKIKLHPTENQKVFIDKNLSLNRFVWNKLLGMQQDRFENGGDYVNAYGMHYLMKALKIEFPFLKEAESTSLEYTSDDLDDAFTRFFTNQNNHPRFKSRKHPKNTYKSKCINHNIMIVDTHYLKLPKLGLVKFFGGHRIQDKIKSATIRRELNGSYTATIHVEHEPKVFEKTGNVIGIDLGLTDLVIQSDGFKLKNKQFERSLAKNRRQWERKFARRHTQALAKIEEAKAQGINLKLSDFKNLHKAKEHIARISKKIANQRANYLQQYTTSLVRKYDLIAMEDLSTKNLMQNHHLARSIADASWAKIKSMLTYKCDWYGKKLILVDARYTSQICSHCGEKTGKKPLHIRRFDCPHCHSLDIDRDVNAAINILNKALAER